MNKLFYLLMAVLSAALLSLPWLVPHCGAVALFALIPLLCADAFATELRAKRFWPYALLTFLLWNAATTFWVCKATVGGGIFAIVVNSLVMTLVWGLFRFCKKGLHGVLPYLFLAFAWIAWERVYFSLDISWPWLTLGNAFAESTRLVQWYEYTGTLGGSLWIWAVNLGIFGLISTTADGYWNVRGHKLMMLALVGVTVILAGPMVLSKYMYGNYEEKSEGSINVLIGQPNIDPYQKFQSMAQAEQTSSLLRLFRDSAPADSTENLLFIAPETFTSDIVLNYPEESPTLQAIRSFLGGYGARSSMLFGASTYELFDTHAAPSILARQALGGWSVSHNSALMADSSSKLEVFHKSRLVVGTELTPYPKVFVPLDNWLSKKMGVYGLMGRCVGQDEISLLHFGNVPIGCAVCYESVYGEYCTGYVRKGAKAIAVITNDAWWGDTPGYRQHLSYSRLRAIELRRDIARCGNTGISCFIDQKGDITSRTEWWEPATLKGKVNLNSSKTFFSQYGDITGRVSTFVFFLLLLLSIVKMIINKK
ncbi:MAG: apolipoprotein N-acyltransferase [Bacteroidales bacterium]|nr:apolipoprotein N-acyltransferase [Bacteroidales bacterium]